MGRAHRYHIGSGAYRAGINRPEGALVRKS